jgi:hypothetical protein
MPVYKSFLALITMQTVTELDALLEASSSLNGLDAQNRIQETSRAVYNCSKCERRFEKAAQLRSHLKDSHRKIIKVSGRIFKRGTDGLFKCEVCGKCFKSASNVEKSHLNCIPLLSTFDLKAPAAVAAFQNFLLV